MTAPAPVRNVGPVTTGASAGYAASVVLGYIVEQLTGRDVPDPVEIALGVCLTVLGGFLVRSRASGAAA